MANWSNPTLTSLYTDFLTELKARDEDLAKQFDGQTVSNLITGTIRWSSSANRWQKWSGTAWGELTTTYALTGLSTTGNATIGGTLGVTGAATLSGGGTSTTPATADNSTAIATTAFVKAQAYATLASPALTGTPTAPTAALNTNTTQVATTAFVINQGADSTPLMAGTAAVGTSLEFARGDHVHPTDTSRAPLASPTFTGTPAAPTAAVGTNTTQLATTAFVQAEIANDAPAKDGTGATGTWSISINGNAGTATTLATARTINGVSFNGSANITVTASTPAALTAGTYLTSAGTFDGSLARTFAVDATSANTASKVVARDASGDFSAGTITAALTGTASGNLALTGGTLSGALLAAAGSLAAPGIATSGDTNTGLWWETADRLVVVSGGARAAYFNATEQYNYGNIFATTADDVAADATTTTRSSNAFYWRGKYWSGTASVSTDWNALYVPTDTAGNGEWRLRNGTTTRLTVNNSGTVTATTFSGSGASLTSLNASNLSSGTVPDARLSGSYTNASIGGNAATATTLATARTINGVSFNGSANISVNTVNSLTFNNGGAGAASGSTFNGGAAVTVSHNTIGALGLAGGTLTGALQTTAGTAAAPGIGIGEATTGLFRPGAGILGFAVGGTESFRLNAAGGMGLGSTGTNVNVGFRHTKNITGGTTAWAQLVDGAVQTDVTSAAAGIGTSIGTAANTLLTSLVHFQAATGTLGVGTTVTNQIGFSASSTLAGATNDYGFYGAIAAGTGNWNCYMVGTAANYFAGQVQLGAGSVSAPSLSTNGDTDTGIYFPAAGLIGFAVNGALAGAFDDAGDLRLYNSAGTFYTNVTNEPTANRTLALPDGNVTLVAGTMAPTASPAFTGTPTAPTAAAGTNTTQIATTAFVKAEIATSAAPNVRYFTTGTGATYTPTSGTKAIYVEVVGGGGGGGGVDGLGTGTAAAAIAGAGGGYSARLITNMSQTFTYTVGAGGSAGAAGNFNGGNAGTSSFTGSVSGTHSATGGTGGNGMLATNTGSGASGSPGGSGTGGDLNLDGSCSGARAIVTGRFASFSLSGCAPFFGGSVVHTGANDTNGIPAVNYGAGGGGASVSDAQTNFSGGAGKAGVVRITEYF